MRCKGPHCPPLLVLRSQAPGRIVLAEPAIHEGAKTLMSLPPSLCAESVGTAQRTSVATGVLWQDLGQTGRHWLC